MQRFAVFLSRFCVTAWVGVATFFVTIVVQLRGSPLFPEPIKLNHPKVLFPLFYSFEFGLLGTAAVAAVVAWQFSPAKTTRSALLVGLLGLALAIGAVDWYAVYRPLSAMLESTVLPANFRAYHTASRWINTAELVISAAAGCVAVWPERHDSA
jgi:hypothetical protein